MSMTVVRRAFDIDDNLYKRIEIESVNTGKPIHKILAELIETKYQNQTTDLYTESYLRDQLTEYVLNNYDVSRLRANKLFHVNIPKQFLELIQVSNTNFLNVLRIAVFNAVNRYWRKRITEQKVKSYDVNLDEQVKLKQLEVKELISDRLKGLDKFLNIPISFSIDCLPTKQLSELTITDLGKLIQTHGTIIGLQSRRTIEDEGIHRFVQHLTIQELEEEAKNNSPVIIPGKTYDEFAGNLAIGQRKKILGFYMPLYDEKTKENKLYLDIVSIQPFEQTLELELSKEQLEKTREFAKQDETGYFKQLIESFAPHIYNRDLEKKALLLALVGGADLGSYRKETHLLLIGEPSTGKSELMKFTISLSNKGSFIDGPNASSKGLLFGLDEWDKGKILRAGAMILCNGGHVAIDEYDKMHPSDRKSLNLVMEQQFAKYDKVGHNVTAEAKTTVIAGCNPDKDRWSKDKTIIDNLRPLDSSSVSRFDVIIKLENVRTSQMADKQMDHILSYIEKNNTPRLDINTFKALLNYCRKLSPRFSDEAKKRIREFYSNFMGLEQSEGSLPIDPRQGVGLLRLCSAYAKLTFRNEIDETTVNEIVGFYKKTLETLGMKTGEVNQMDLNDARANKQEWFEKTFKTLEDEIGIVHEEPLVNEMIRSKKWTTKLSCRKFLEEMKNQGWIFEPTDYRWKRQ